MPPRKKAKKPKIGFDCMADRLDKTFYSLIPAKPAPPLYMATLILPRSIWSLCLLHQWKAEKCPPHRLPAHCRPCHISPWAAPFQLALLLPFRPHEWPTLCLFYRLPWKKATTVVPWDFGHTSSKICFFHTVEINHIWKEKNLVLGTDPAIFFFNDLALALPHLKRGLPLKTDPTQGAPTVW